MDRAIKKQLLHYAQVFTDGRQRNANEADTVMYIVRFLTDVLGYDLFKDVTKEFQVRERYCDVALKIDGEVKILIEVKAMALSLSDRHIEQAENYASRSGLPWVILTNGLTWRLYHLTFDANGIEHDLAFECELGPEADLEAAWECLALLSRQAVAKGELTAFWEQKKTLSPQSLLRALFTEPVLQMLRRELRQKATARIELEAIAQAVRRLLNPEVMTEEIRITKARKKRRTDGKTMPSAPTTSSLPVAPTDPTPDTMEPAG